MPLPSFHDYALIGNRSSAALISRSGGIDWCCFPYLDSPSHFASLIDKNMGGKFQISPQGDFRSEQRCLQRTLVVETLFETPHGRATLTDWMPAQEGHENDPVIHRKLEVLSGKIAWILLCSPKFGYGAEGLQAEYRSGAVLFRGSRQSSAELRSSLPLQISEDGSSAVARFELESGQSASFVWSWGREPVSALKPELTATSETWRKWAHHCEAALEMVGGSAGETAAAVGGQPGLTRSTPSSQTQTRCIFAGPWHDAISRASLLVKIVSAPYSGAVADAITTTPEDRRYAWIRNSAGLMRSLKALGYQAEANAHFGFLSDILMRDGAEGLQTVYTLDGGKLLPELDLPHLAGTAQAHVGNRASKLFHLDVYGELMMAAEEHLAGGGAIADPLWERLTEIAEYVCQAWRRPDYGTWDLPGRPEHFVSSKVFCWAALDRACKIGRALKKRIPTRWEQEQKTLHHTICLQGYDAAKGSFISAFGNPTLDSSVLLIPLLGFLPLDDQRVLSTLDTVRAELSSGVLIYRNQFSAERAVAEAPLLWSSFAFVSCLAISGKESEASDRLAELCTHMTSVGLLGSQIEPDVEGGETAGVFPCTTATIALIDAALSIGKARRQRVAENPAASVGLKTPAA
jgi:GH15 family glucan-1,4-alpha-glucosidase